MAAKYQSKLDLESRVPLQDVIPLEIPFIIFLNPSSICNFKCEYCPSTYSTEEDYPKLNMDLDLFKKIIDDLQEFKGNLKVLRLYKFGEPLINKNIIEMIKYAKNSGKIEHIDTTTNGFLLTNEMSLKLVDSGLNRIDISIQGINEEQYKKYANVNIDFEKFYSQIKFLYENKKNMEITIKIPSNYLTDEDKKKFLDLFSPYCDRIYFENLTSVYPNFDLNQSSEIIKINEFKNQYNNDKPKNLKVCSEPFFKMCIDANGIVSPCAFVWKQELIIGNVKKQSLKEIWNSKELKNIQIKSLTKKIESISACYNCQAPKYTQIDDIDDYANELLKRLIK